MQQTTQYQFNLLESSDPVSVTPMNENMEKTEAALLAAQEKAENDLAEQVSSLTKAIAARGNCFLEVGTYEGNSTANHTITLGYKPKLLILLGKQSSLKMMTVATASMALRFVGDYSIAEADYISLTSTGFTLLTNIDHNYKGNTETYIAFH